MKIIKKGTVKNGKMQGWIIDCEGGSIDLNEIIQFSKVKEAEKK